MTFWKNIFHRKPKSLGEGLARIKKMMGLNAPCEPIVHIPGNKRIYATPNGDRVLIKNFNEGALSVDLYPNIPYSTSNEKISSILKSYIGKLQGIMKNYKTKIDPVKGERTLDKSVATWHFEPYKSEVKCINHIADTHGVYEYQIADASTIRKEYPNFKSTIFSRVGNL